jgi:ATP-dependent Lhr-like helicase
MVLREGAMALTKTERETIINFNEGEEDFPDIRVLTRSGDTPQPDRRQMLRHPPEILITTPESLNLLLK